MITTMGKKLMGAKRKEINQNINNRKTKTALST